MTLQPDNPEIHAEEAGLRYLTDDVPGVRRRRAGEGFVYIGLDGKRVTDPDRIAWFKRLAVPPAWTDVWISPIKRGHVQATGRDARGRKQYRYHPRWRAVRDRRLARLVRECHELPGQELFQYLDEDGKRQSIDSGAVNDYLREISGEDFTTKDFRTWAGTVAASLALAEFLEIDDDAGRKKAIVRAIEEVAEQLGNTPAVCRTCYVHPDLLASYLDGTMIDALAERARGVGRGAHALRPEEAAVLGLLQARLARERHRRQRPAA